MTFTTNRKSETYAVMFNTTLLTCSELIVATRSSSEHLPFLTVRGIYEYYQTYQYYLN